MYEFMKLKCKVVSEHNSAPRLEEVYVNGGYLHAFLNTTVLEVHVLAGFLPDVIS
jgi:hypothetical protein